MSQRTPTDFEVNAYAENFVLYGDKSRAWRITFPDSKAKDKSVNEKASKYHSLVKVLSRIDEIHSRLSKQSEVEFDISVSDLKKMLVIAAQGGLVKRTDAQGNNILNNISGAVSAISEINKMDGNYAATKQDTKITHNIMPMPTADSVEGWEAQAQKQQDEALKNV